MRDFKKELKTELLIRVQCSSNWRCERATEYREQSEKNRNAYLSLGKLYDFILKLPEDHPMFIHLAEEYSKQGWMEQVISSMDDKIRIYGFQIRETPEEFVERTLM